MRFYDIGFLGGGQLARMSIQAAQRMGLRCLSLDPGDPTPASGVADSIQGSLSDPAVIQTVIESCDRVTLENEFIPANAIEEALLQSGRGAECVIPGVEALANIQDKLRQKTMLREHGVPAPYAEAIGPTDMLVSDEFPFVLKARFGGYDGKGTHYARTREEFERFRPLVAAGDWMTEELVEFKRELAVMVVVSNGIATALPTVETVQSNHVCDLVLPSEADGAQIAVQAANAMGGQGLFGVELFELADGTLMVNEIAPRPHNSGHYTLDWGGPSQFEAHVRAVMGWPHVEPVSDGYAVMANLLGQPEDGDLHKAIASALEVVGAHVHWYGKAESRPGRKMGHINVSGKAGEPVEETVSRAVEARRRFYEAWA